MPPPSGMPELPGMWYDETRNRYFRITQENKPSPSPTEHSLLGTSAHQGPNGPSISRLLRRAEEGKDHSRLQTLPTTLLANAKVSKFCPEEDEPEQPTVDFSITDAIPLVAEDEGLFLSSYRASSFRVTQICRRNIVDMDWQGSSGLLAFTFRSCHRNEFRYALVQDEFAKVSNGTIDTNRMHWIDIQEYPFAVAVGSRKSQVFSGKAATYYGLAAWTRRRGENLGMKLSHPDKSPGFSVVSIQNMVFTGTRAGHVLLWDTRASTDPVCSFRPSGSHCSISDMKMGCGENTLFVSCMRNERNNLAGWDLRMCDSNPDPVIVFDGHVNSHKRLKFDVEETGSGGILLAGGNDSLVRMWSMRTGGQSMGRRLFSGEFATRVKLAGWGKDRAGVPPGAWIVTNKGAYIMSSACFS